jgi:hypothetical protein
MATPFVVLGDLLMFSSRRYLHRRADDTVGPTWKNHGLGYDSVEDAKVPGWAKSN